MRVLVGVSGGLDSAYAVMKLKREGYDVEGAVLVMHEYTELDAARKVCDLLSIPLHVIDVKESFNKRVKEYFVREYSLGRTPNPCVVCNRDVKMRGLYEYAVSNGFDRIATGHYSEPVRIQTDRGSFDTLKMAKDRSKDQTYMLSMCGSDILSRLLLPLCDITKEEIRKEVASLGMSVFDRDESQEICFLPDNDYPRYIESKLGAFKEGNFIDEYGRILGRHKGIIHYTVGQRKGLGVSHTSRLFITKIDPVSNNITLSETKNETSTIFLSSVNCLGIAIGDEPTTLELLLQHRYRSALTKCTVELSPDRTAKLFTDHPVSSVTPGQIASLYDGDTLIMGGIIERTL